MTIWTAEVGHEDDCFGSMVAGVFDGGKGADNALVVCDAVIRVERDVKINL